MLEDFVDNSGFSNDAAKFFTVHSSYPAANPRGESQIRVWDTSTGQAIGKQISLNFAVESVTFADDDEKLVVVGESGAFWVADIASGDRVDESNNIGFLSRFQKAWISPDNLHLATIEGSESGLTATRARACRVWNLMRGEKLPYLLHHAGVIRHAVFHPDGDRIATCGDDQTVRIWNLATAHPTIPPQSYHYPWEYVRWIKLSDDAERVLVYYADVGLQLWDVKTGQPLTPVRVLPDIHERFDGAWGLEHHATPDCNATFYVTRQQGLRFLDLISGESTEVASRVHDSDGSPMLVHFCKQSQRVLVRLADGERQRWEVRDLRQVDKAGIVLDFDQLVETAVFSPSGKEVLLRSWWGTARQRCRVYDTATGRLLWTLPTDEPKTANLYDAKTVYSPDGRWFALGFQRDVAREAGAQQRRHFLQLFDMRQRRAVGSEIAFPGHLKNLKFSGDGITLLSGVTGCRSEDPAVSPWCETRLWNASTAEPIADPVRHDGLHFATFDKDASVIATAGADGTVRIWDTDASRPRTGPLPHPGSVSLATFSHDGTLLATVAKLGVHKVEGRVWDVRTGEPVTPALPLDSCYDLRFSADDRKLLADCWASWEGESLRVIPLPIVGDKTETDRWARLLSLHKLDDSGSHVPIDRKIDSFVMARA